VGKAFDNNANELWVNLNKSLLWVKREDAHRFYCAIVDFFKCYAQLSDVGTIKFN